MSPPAVHRILSRLSSDPPIDLVLVAFPEGNGTATGAELLRGIRAAEHDLPAVAVGDHDDVQLASEAVAAGASDSFVAADHLEERATLLLAKDASGGIPSPPGARAPGTEPPLEPQRGGPLPNRRRIARDS